MESARVYLLRPGSFQAAFEHRRCLTGWAGRYKLFNADGEVLVGSDHEESVLLLDCLPMRWEFPKRELPPDEPKLPAKAIEPYVKEQKR
eukprot:1167985-Rhodomonas_salina.2